MALIDGDDAISGRYYPYQHFNRIKNNWRQAAPKTNVTNPQPGMIESDSDDERVFHKRDTGFGELLQADLVLISEGEVLCGEGEILTCGL